MNFTLDLKDLNAEAVQRKEAKKQACPHSASEIRNKAIVVGSRNKNAQPMHAQVSSPLLLFWYHDASILEHKTQKRLSGKGPPDSSPSASLSKRQCWWSSRLTWQRNCFLEKWFNRIKYRRIYICDSLNITCKSCLSFLPSTINLLGVCSDRILNLKNNLS